METVLRRKLVAHIERNRVTVFLSVGETEMQTKKIDRSGHATSARVSLHCLSELGRTLSRRVQAHEGRFHLGIPDG